MTLRGCDDATRPPNGDAATYTVPYFVASVLNGTTILQKQIVATSFGFGPGEATTTFTANVPSTVMHLETGKKPYEYGMLVGIQRIRSRKS